MFKQNSFCFLVLHIYILYILAKVNLSPVIKVGRNFGAHLFYSVSKTESFFVTLKTNPGRIFNQSLGEWESPFNCSLYMRLTKFGFFSQKKNLKSKSTTIHRIRTQWYLVSSKKKKSAEPFEAPPPPQKKRNLWTRQGGDKQYNIGSSKYPAKTQI
jgi:hypothetical protein